METAHRQGNDQDANAPSGRYFHDDACKTRKKRDGFDGRPLKDLQTARLQRRRHYGYSY